MNMNKRALSLASRTLLATALAAGAAGAFAGNANTLGLDKETLVHVGMTQDEVRQALGRPAQNQKFMNEAGPTWSYKITGAPETAVFDVDFGSDGTVASVSERLVPEQ